MRSYSKFDFDLCDHGLHSIVDFADRLFDPIKYESQAEKRREQMQVFDIADMEEVFSPSFLSIDTREYQEFII